MDFNLADQTLFITLSGSRAYGFANEDSDYDYRGIMVAPIDHYIGITPKFEQIVDTDKSKNTWKHYPEGLVRPNEDMQIMEITKFVKLALQCNPSILEILFSNDESIIFKNPIIQTLLDAKQSFLSVSVKDRFCGYAKSQLHKIKQHKSWIDENPVKPEFVEGEDKQKFEKKLKEYNSYQHMISERNPKRLALEVSFGYDCKHAAHLFRLMSMAKEIISEGKVLVKRPDAELIKSIRNGSWTYDQVIAFADDAEIKINELMKTTCLPNEPDFKLINQITQEIIYKCNLKQFKELDV